MERSTDPTCPKLLEHSISLRARRFHVEHRTYEHPGPKMIVRDVVVHPGAVVILPILDPHHFVMIRNFRHAAGEELIELPAGTMEPGEPPIETARRELEEETGYCAGVIEPFIEFFTSPGVLTERMRAFVAGDLTWVGQRLEDSERITVEVVGIAEARRLLKEGRLLDGKSIAVLGTFFARDIGDGGSAGVNSERR